MKHRKAVRLTPKQVDIADWLLGCPSMDLHSFPDETFEIYGRDMSHLTEPKLDKKADKLILLADRDVIENSIEELERYEDMAKEASELTKTEMMAEVRLSKDLRRKLSEAAKTKKVRKMRCKVCGEELKGNNKYDLNEKRETVTRCSNGHLQVVFYDWDSGKYVVERK